MGSLSPVQKMMLARLMAGLSPYPEGEPVNTKKKTAVREDKPASYPVFRAPSRSYLRPLAAELRKLVKAANGTALAWTNVPPEDQERLRKHLNLPCGCQDPFEKVEMLRTWLAGLKDLLHSTRRLMAQQTPGNGPSPGTKKRR